MDGKEVKLLKGHIDDVNSVAFSRDGLHLVSGSGNWNSKKDNSVRIWDWQNGKEIAKFIGHERSVNSVCFNP